MTSKKQVLVPYKRKKNGKTNYRKRLNLLKSGKLRIVVRKSLKNISMQLVEYSAKGDKILLSISSQEIVKLGWKYSCGNIPAAYLTGLVFGKKAVGKKVKGAIVDFGLYQSVKGSRLYATLKGILDGGLSFPHSADNLPDENRISGKHIVDYGAKSKGTQFSGLAKKKIIITDLPKNFEEVKAKIIGS